MTPLLLLMLAQPAVQRPASYDRTARIRPQDAVSRVAIQDGLDSSPTLTRLVETVERSRVIVYVRAVPGLRRAGMMTLIAHTEVVTYLQVQFDPALTRQDLIGTLAHELTHVLEVATASPPVRNDADLERLYGSIGIPGAAPHEFESLMARANEQQVRQELGRVLSTPTAEPPDQRQQG